MVVEWLGLEQPVLGEGDVVQLSCCPDRSPFPCPCKEPEHLRANSEPVTPSEDDIAEAERLKTEGNLPRSRFKEL